MWNSGEIVLLSFKVKCIPLRLKQGNMKEIITIWKTEVYDNYQTSFNVLCWIKNYP